MLDTETILRTTGYLGIFAIIFAESGLALGFFLPGDSLLFTAGFLAAQGLFGLSLIPLLVGCCLAAILGDNVGYNFGRQIGPRLLRRKKSLLFSPNNVAKAQAFYAAHGPQTIVLARFVPVIRTFAPIVAGIGSMPYRQFVSFNIVGGLLWTCLFIGLGYGIGNVPGTQQHIHVIVLAVIVLSLMPPAWHILRDRQRRQKLFDRLRRLKKSR